jgi:hypothetical protein
MKNQTLWSCLVLLVRDVEAGDREGDRSLSPEAAHALGVAIGGRVGRHLHRVGRRRDLGALAEARGARGRERVDEDEVDFFVSVLEPFWTSVALSETVYFTS